MRSSWLRRSALIGAVAMAALAVSGCTAPVDSPDVITGEWRILSGTLSDGSPLELSGPPPTVVFTDGVPTLFQTCTPPPIQRTSAADAESCLPETGSRLANVLPVSPSLTRSGESLIVTGVDPDLRLVLYPADTVVLADLVGTWVTTEPSWLHTSTHGFEIADDGSIAGNTDCANFSGSVNHPVNGVLGIDTIDIVSAPCDRPQPDQPMDPLVSALGSSLIFHLDAHGHLEIIPEGRAPALEFIRTGAVVLDDLSATSWVLDYAHDSTGPIIASTGIALYFRDDGISGDLQCGSWTAPSSEQRGEARDSAQNLLPIKERHLEASDAVCRNGPFKDRYLSALASVTAAVIHDNALILSGNGADLRFDRLTMELGN